MEDVSLLLSAPPPPPLPPPPLDQKPKSPIDPYDRDHPCHGFLEMFGRAIQKAKDALKKYDQALAYEKAAKGQFNKTEGDYAWTLGEDTVSVGLTVLTGGGSKAFEAARASVKTGVTIGSDAVQLGIDIHQAAQAAGAGDTFGAGLSMGGIAGSSSDLVGTITVGAGNFGKGVARIGGSVTGATAVYNYLSYYGNSSNNRVNLHGAQGSAQGTWAKFEAVAKRLDEVIKKGVDNGCWKEPKL